MCTTPFRSTLLILQGICHLFVEGIDLLKGTHENFDVRVAKRDLVPKQKTSLFVYVRRSHLATRIHHYRSNRWKCNQSKHKVQFNSREIRETSINNTTYNKAIPENNVVRPVVFSGRSQSRRYGAVPSWQKKYGEVTRVRRLVVQQIILAWPVRSNN